MATQPEPAREQSSPPSRPQSTPPTRSASGGARARHAYDGLDRILHEKARLGILTALLTRPEGASFVELKALCSLTDGNLNRHLAVLQGAEFVTVNKVREGSGAAARRTRTSVQMTGNGRQAFLDYLEELERVVRDARAAVRPSADSTPPPGLAPA